jgi:DNA-binding NarL/FixJ family response regulator
MSLHQAAALQPKQAIRILVADHSRMASQLLAESLGRNPRFEIIAVAAGADIFSAHTREASVALVSMEYDAGSKRGLAVARTLHAAQPRMHLVILLEAGTRESVIAAFRCGASGVFCASQPISELHDCIEHVSRGGIWADGDQAQHVLEALWNMPSCNGFEDGRLRLLSKRELQVAEQAAQGQSNKQIADALKLSEHTVKNYLFRIFEKLGVSSRFELLFLLFNERDSTVERGTTFDVVGGNQPVKSYLKAAEDGLIAAQYLIGLAHLEGQGMEKNGRSAYYWLRLAEENSRELRQRAHALTEELRSTMPAEEFQTLEHSIAAAIDRNQLQRIKTPEEFIKRSMASASLKIAV